MFTFNYVGSDEGITCDADNARDAIVEIYNRRQPIMGLDLRNLDLSSLNLSDVTFEHCNLSGANFYDANLTGAWLNGCVTEGVTFRRANLTRAILKDLVLSGSDFAWSVCTYTNFHRAHLYECCFDDANLDCADFSNAWLNQATMYGASIRGTDFSDAYMVGMGFDIEPEPIHAYLRYCLETLYPCHSNVTPEIRFWIYRMLGLSGIIREVPDVFLRVFGQGGAPTGFRDEAKELRSMIAMAVRYMPNTPRLGGSNPRDQNRNTISHFVVWGTV